MLNELYKDCHITEKPLSCNLYIYQGQLGNWIEYHADVSFPLCFDAMTFNLQPNYFHYVSRITILTREIVFNGRCKILVLHVLFISIWCSNNKNLVYSFLFLKFSNFCCYMLATYSVVKSHLGTRLDSCLLGNCPSTLNRL